MTTNTIDSIKQAEAEAKVKVAEARQKIENLVSQANQDGQSSLNQAENQVSNEIQEILNDAKTKINSLKAKQERELAGQLQLLQSINDQKINRAAETVLKEVTK
ncbi:MAG: hypothetical protein RB292_00450 [Patescibacteria group bacterium]|jgi:vacuolar-type H+-ATPase subunit H|nr:hypothetical protein [Patescibacteria group bacterium]